MSSGGGRPVSWSPFYLVATYWVGETSIPQFLPLWCLRKIVPMLLESVGCCEILSSGVKEPDAKLVMTKANDLVRATDQACASGLQSRRTGHAHVLGVRTICDGLLFSAQLCACRPPLGGTSSLVTRLSNNVAGPALWRVLRELYFVSARFLVANR